MGRGGSVRDGGCGAEGAESVFGRSPQKKWCGGLSLPAAEAWRPPLRAPLGDCKNPSWRFASDRRGEGVVVEDIPQASPVVLCPCRTTTGDRTSSLPAAETHIKAEKKV